VETVESEGGEEEEEEEEELCGQEREVGSRSRKNSGAGGGWWGGEIGMPRGRGGFKKGVGRYVYVGVLMREDTHTV